MNVSWLDTTCTQSTYDKRGCVGCTLPNNIKKNNLFELRGLCWRTGFDTQYMIMNDEETGKNISELISRDGCIYEDIQIR